MGRISHEGVASWGTGQSTNADSATYQQLPNKAAISCSLINDTGATIALRRSGTTDDPILIPNGVTAVFPLSGSVDEIEWRRSDGAATSTTITYSWSL
jgi:hypothetical protein